MEAAPRLQMLCFEQKLSPKVSDFSHSFKKFIATFYNEDPNKYSKAIFDLEQLRTAACKASKDFQGILTLRRYYSQLRLQQNRFPMTDDGAACVAFMWSDLYSGVMFNIADVKYELSSILYNIGALHSQLGAIEDRTTAEGMKNACTHFQAAAWAFQHNRDTYPQPKGCDLSHDLLTFYSLVMLGQSQECILEKSMLDNRKSGISAKIASQIVDFYTKSINNLSSDVKSIVGTKIFQQWKRICEMKAAYYGALTALHMGMMAEEDNQYGLRVSWYRLAMERFDESLRAAEDIGIEDTLAFTRDVIGGKLNVAVRENDFVYHDKVLSAESLPEVKGAVLVKGTPFDPNDPEVCGPDLFSTLIPMAAHEASSVYSEQKAQILRRISKIVEDKDADLASYESSLKISKKDLISMMKKPTLPPDVIEVCAQFSTNRLSISSIKAQLAQIDAMSEEVGKHLDEAEQLIAMSNPASVTSNVVADLKAELNKYKEIRNQSANNNGTLRKALKDHDDYLALLQLAPEILEQKLPHVIAVTRDDEKVILEFIKLLDKLEEMKQQRQKLFSDLRDSLINDDITKLIVANAQEDLNEVFEKALSKHKQSIAILEKNLLAQDNILKAVSQANANTAEIRLNLDHARKPWTTSIEGLRAAYKSFEEVGLHAAKGTDFYGIFVNDVRRLATRLRSVVQVEKEQEERLRARQAELAQPPVVKPGVSPGYPLPAPRTPALASTTAPQSGQPPKLKDYLTMMNNAKRNEYVPQAMPGSPGISHNNLQPSVAMSSMGSSTSLTGNAQPPQMSLPASSMNQNNMSNQSVTNSAVLPPGAQIVPAPVSMPSNVPQPQASDPRENTHHVTPQNTAGAGAGTGAIPSGTQSSMYTPPARTGQLYGAYQANNTVNYGQAVYHGYAPYAHLYTTSPQNPRSTLAAGVDPKSMPTSNSPSVPATGGTFPYATASQQQFQSSFHQARVSEPQKQGENLPGNGAPVTHVAPATPSSNLNTSLKNSGVPNTPVTTVNQGQYYPNPSQNEAGSGFVANAYRWSGYNLPTAAPTASASTVMTSGVYNSILTNSNNLYNNANSYAQYYQMYGQQYQRYGIPPQTDATPNNATQTTIGYPYPNSSLPVSSTVTSSARAASSIVSTIPSHAQVPGHPVPNSTVAAPSTTFVSNAVVQGQGTKFVVPTPPYPQNTNLPTSHGQSSLNGIGSVTSHYLPNTPNVGIPTNTQSIPQANVPPPTAQTTITSNNVASRELNSLLDESPALQMPSEGQIPQNILQPVVLSAVTEPDEPRDAVPSEQSNGSVSETPVFTRDEITEPVDVATIPTLNPKPENSLDDARTLQNFRNAFNQLDDYTRTFHLENRWKEFLDLQEAEGRALKISVGRICSMKNRFPDIMPYDYNRVVLNTTKDDYINASYLKSEAANEPNCILTQAPIPSTLEDFWAMVWEQGAETLLSLSSFQELSSQLFFPSEKGTVQSYGQYQVSVQSFTEKEAGLFTERLLSVSGPQGPAKNLILLHLNEWTRDVSKLALFGNQVLYYYTSQKRKESPVIIQCLGGCGRSGVIAFCIKWLSHLREARLSTVVSLLGELVRGRKLALLEKDQLKICVDFAHHTARAALVEKGCIEQISEKATEIEEIHNKEKNGEQLTVEERLIQDLMAGFQVKTKITKESFEKPRGLQSATADPSDPLSQLDPLWSLKK